MSGVYLVAAIASETTGTLSLKLASDGKGLRWYGVVMVGYLAAFAMLTLALTEGLPLGVAYGIWSAGGVVLIMAGVLLVELGSPH